MTGEKRVGTMSIKRHVVERKQKSSANTFEYLNHFRCAQTQKPNTEIEQTN